MKYILTLFLTLFSFHIYTQVESHDWTKACLTMADGKTFHTKIVLTDQLYEGAIIANSEGKYHSLSPEQVDEFEVYLQDDTVGFTSVTTSFWQIHGKKKLS